MSASARLALDALVLFVAGLAALVLLALLTYEPGGPSWPHAVVDGGGWLLIGVCAVAWLVAGTESVVRRWRGR